ncbi:MAG: hypothetical protein ABW118_16990 [Candidatus Thiodiazotropha sp.]
MNKPYFADGMTEKEWERFCEIMLRYHFGQKNFWKVPDEDQGDYGIEFYTADGTIFQCYLPDPTVDMKNYKKKIQKKINDDLKKLDTYQNDIADMLDDIIIKQWVLMTPQNKSKELIKYCNKKKKEVLAKNLSFIDNKAFQVRVETADTFPEGKLFAHNICLRTIDIPLATVSQDEKEAWQEGNSEFTGNIDRKTKAIFGMDNSRFKDEIVTKYIQIEQFLDRLREDFPDIYNLIEDSARAQLESMQQSSILEDNFDKEFIKRIVSENKETFDKYSDHFSDSSKQPLPFGYLSKWIAECYMDFVDV